MEEMSGPAREQLDAEGWCVVPLLQPAELSELDALAGAIDGIDRVGFFASHAVLAPEPRTAVADRVRAVLAPALVASWPAAMPVASALLAKAPRTGSPLPFHQDLTYSDERTTRSYVCWAPLVDLVEDSGQLRVVPGSHRWSDRLRPGGPQPMPTERFQVELDGRSVPVPVRAGEAVIWDAALVHGSRANHGSHLRTVATLAFLQHPAPLQYFHRDRHDRVEGFAIDHRFFASPRPFVDRPEGYAPVEPWAGPVRPEDVSAHLEAVVPEGRRW